MIRCLIWYFVASFVLIVWHQSSITWQGSQRGYGYTWEHSLQEWAEHTAKMREPHAVWTYGPVNRYDPKKGFHEQFAWVMIKVRD
jgi:hypothetical protein